MARGRKPNPVPCRFCGKRVREWASIQLVEGAAIYCTACLVAAEEFCRSAADLVLNKQLTADELCVHFSNGTAQELLAVPKRNERPDPSGRKPNFVTCAKCRNAVPYTAPWPMVTSPGAGEFSGKRLCDSCARVPVQAGASSDDDIHF